jgi:hypothetical protein
LDSAKIHKTSKQFQSHKVSPSFHRYIRYLPNFDHERQSQN